MAFPKTANWYENHCVNNAEKIQFQQFLTNVNYHIKFSENADMQCGRMATAYDYHLIGKDKVSLSFASQDIVRFGDIAIREAASAIDTSISLINSVLCFPIEKGKRVIWRNREEKSGLGYKIETIEKYSNLVRAIDTTYDSIGFRFLNQYRNWVTHRGAPGVQVDQKLNRIIELPAEVSNSINPNFPDHALMPFLYKLVESMTRIRCKRFAIPAKTIYGANIKEADKNIQLPGGVDIEKGVRDVQIDRFVVQGSPYEQADKYLAENGALLEKDMMEYAGEKLAIYQLSDYIHSVHSASRFAEQCLSENWDRELRAICESRQS